MDKGGDVCNVSNGLRGSVRLEIGGIEICSVKVK